MAYDPLKLAGEHHRSLIDHMARARADENCIKQLLVGRMVTTEVYAHPIRVSDVMVKGHEIQIWGRNNPKRRRSILLATHLAGIRIVNASDKDAPSNKEADAPQKPAV